VSKLVERQLRALGFDRWEVENIIKQHGESEALRVVHDRNARVPATPDALYEYLRGMSRMGRLLVEHGEPFKIEPYDRSRFELGEMGKCFANAYGAVVLDKRRSTYVEGFVISGLGVPMQHALVVENDTGRAFDVTWRWSERETLHRPSQSAFIGVRVSLEVLQAHWRTCGGAAVLDDYAHDCPALSVPYDEWDAVLPGKLAKIRETHCMREVRAGRARLTPTGAIIHQDIRHGP
jgi:hypothetical protein